MDFRGANNKETDEVANMILEMADFNKIKPNLLCKAALFVFVSLLEPIGVSDDDMLEILVKVRKVMEKVEEEKLC